MDYLDWSSEDSPAHSGAKQSVGAEPFANVTSIDQNFWKQAVRIGALPTPCRSLCFVVMVALLFVATAAAKTEPVGRRVFHNSIMALPDEAAATMRAPDSGNLADTMEIELPLQMRNFQGLLDKIARNKIISPQEMALEHLPLSSDYEALKQWLESEGFTITRTDPNRLAIFAQGTVAGIQKSLQTEMVEVTVKGKHYHAAHTHPSLPAAIAGAVVGINGLQPYLKMLKRSVTTPNSPPYLVHEILGAYNATSLGVTGSGQKIAILIDTVPANSDLTAFWTNNNIPQSLSNIETVNVNNISPLPTPSGEETLDVEWSSGIAPAAKVRVYAAGSLSFTYLDKALQQIISDLPTQPQLHQLSISLGLGETYLLPGSQMQTDAQYFASIAAGGVSIFVSSGDGGSTPDNSGGSTGPLQVEYYASDPSVTGVGGTTLHLNSSTGQVSTETAWASSGGGVSQYFSRPSWQTGAGVPTGTMRLVPDVALAADPNTGAYVYLNGTVQQIGGTSWSAPSWAGFCALINQARAQASQPPIGLLNPNIYPLIGSSNFRDITAGSNGNYSAGTGYDSVTGIGVPNMAVLLPTLSSTTTGAPSISAISPTSGPVGTSVGITGLNFNGVTAVNFNGTSASYTVNSSTQITAVVPAGATKGPVTVVTSSGTATSAVNFTITIPGMPSISGFTPASGPVSTSVSVTGANFTGASAVLFNGTASTFAVNSSTQITATVPTGAATGPISVINATGTAVSSSSFTVTTGNVTLYFTGFESSEGYSSSSALAGQKGWLKSGSGGNGIKKLKFPGQGWQAYIGQTAPTSGTSLAVWQPINYTPAAGEVITFSALMDIVDSSNSNYDTFRWSVYNTAGTRLFSIAFNNATNVLTYVLDDGTVHTNDSQLTLVNGTIYTLQAVIDFSHNTWSATLSGSSFATNQPVTTGTAALNLGNIDAVWLVQSTTAGNNYMMFDNYNITRATPVLPTYTITTSASPATGGTTSGSGVFTSGSNATVIATPNYGYAFSSWLENGTTASTASAYTFSVTGNRTLVASFQPLTFTITTSAAPAGSGTASGGGVYNYGSVATVGATPVSGYGFAAWMESGTAASLTGSFSFSVTGNRTLVANFQPANIATWKSTWFSPTDLATPSVSGDLATPNGDGICNLLDYAFDLNPKMHNSPASLPQVSMQGGYLALTYLLNKTATDLVYTVEVSGDLQSWNSGTGYTSAPALLNDNGFTQTFQVTDLILESSTNRRFIRLRVSGP